MRLDFNMFKMIQPDVVKSCGKVPKEKGAPKTRKPGKLTINKMISALKARGCVSAQDVIRITGLVECTVFRAARHMQDDGLMTRSHVKAKCGNDRTYFKLVA